MNLKQCETMLSTIKEITQLSQLRSLRHQFQQAIINSTEDIVIVNETINRLHDQLIQKSIQLVEQEMIGEGLGPPPSPYCYLLFGSGGRYEQTLGSDQDSGLIYADSDGNNEERQRYFLQFANKIVSALEFIGYSPCDGKVQSNVPLWCNSVTNWKLKLQGWIEEADWESIRYILICFDMRVVEGNKALYDELIDYLYLAIEHTPSIYQRMIDNTIHHRVMVNVFGQLLTVKYGDDYGSIDIKYGAYIPFVNAIRWFAIRYGIKSSSTLQRLEQLYIKKVFTDDEYLTYRKAFLHFLELRLRTGVVENNQYYESYKMIKVIGLEKNEIKMIKNSLQTGRKLQKHIQYFIRHSAR